MELEVHRCDLCDELLYIPERSLHQLELDRGDNDQSDLSWELCSECYTTFLKWIETQGEASDEKGNQKSK